MKPFILGLSLTCLITLSYGQEGYQPGLIVTQSSDTIQCLVPITTSFGNKFLIKKDEDEKANVMLLQEVKYLATAYIVYEHILYQNKNKEIHKLMQLVEEGKVNLYREVIINKGAPKGNYTPFVAPTITYVLKKEGQTYLIAKKNFIQVILPLIDLPELRTSIENKALRYSDLEEIVKQYNLIQAKAKS